jgi:hypothetical protein
MQGPQEDIADRRAFDHFARVHHGHPVGHARHHAQVVADVHDRGVEIALQVGDQIEHGRLDGHIQRGGRFIHDEQRGVVEQGHGDDNALLLAAGDLMREALHHVGRIGHVDPLQHLDAFRLRRLLVQAPMHDQRLGQLIAQAQRGVERLHRVLIHHGDAIAADLAQVAIGLAHQVLALKQDLAADDLAVAPQKIHDAERDGALAAARLADDAERLAALDVEADPAHRRHVAPPRFIGDRQVAHVEDGDVGTVVWYHG